MESTHEPRHHQDRGCRCFGPNSTLRLKRWVQRRLRSTQPIPSPGVILTIYVTVGCTFLLIGVVLHFTYQAVVELRHDYTDEIVDANGVVSFEMMVDRDMNGPIWVFYELSGFHQNHRLYVDSRDDSQLMSPEYARSEKPQACHPKIETDGRGIDYPCGLVASTVFNDTFHVSQEVPNGSFSRLEVDTRARSIAWAGDLKRFVNLDPEAQSFQNPSRQNQHTLNMWLLRYFPPVKCQQVQLGPSNPLMPVKVATRIDSDNGPPREVPDCTGYTGSPSCNFTRAGQSFECTGPSHKQEVVEDWGLTSGHFLVWMRTAALPTFRKAWGKVDTDIKAGTRLMIYVEHNFPVKEFYGRKAFVMSTASVVGGRNAFLGIAYVVVGAACLIFAPIFFINSLNSSNPGRRNSRSVQPE